MDEAAGKRGGRRALIGSVVFGLLLSVIYVLSSAPARQMAISGNLNEDVCQTIYAPLIWLHNHSDVAAGALDGYWRWWSRG